MLQFFQITNRLSHMRFSAKTVRAIQKVFKNEMEKGIHQQPSSLQMENTYIPELPDGTGMPFEYKLKFL